MSVLSRSALEESPLADLHVIATELGIDGFRRLRKAELIDTILAAQDGGEEEGVTDEDAGEPDESGGEPDESGGEPDEAPAPRPRRSRRGGRGRTRRDADEDTDGEGAAE